jgi:hypothetical protein
MKMAETPKIFSTINSVMSELGAITKNKRNQQQGFSYRGVDDVMNALNPLMVKNKLFCVPKVLRNEREERQTSRGSNLLYSIVTMEYTLYAEDGSSVSAVVIGEGMDSGDKATNKAMAIAYKYAMFQIFSIPTEETAPDADRDTPEESAPEPAKQPDTAQNEPPKLICIACKKAIAELRDNSGNVRTAQQVAEFTYRESGAQMCWDCFKRWKNGENL